MFKFPKFNRINFRLKIKDITLFFMLSKTQKLEGINSIADNEDNHYIFFDIEDYSLEQTEETLLYVQKKYQLSNIYITSDLDYSYRAFCFSKFDYKSMLKILLDVSHLDIGFFNYTVENHKSCLRISQKPNRNVLKCISVLYSYYQPMPKILNLKLYETSTDGKTINVLIGDKN